MADCSAAGTALDRVLHSAVSSALHQQSNHNGIADAASRHAVSAFGSFLGGAAATATSSSSVVMPAGPMEAMPSSPWMTAGNNRDAAYPGPSTVVPNSSRYIMHASSLRGAPLHMPPRHAVPHPMMMMQQQYQMMQHMQMQQMQMAAMVERQRAARAGQHEPSVAASNGESETLVAESNDAIASSDAETDEMHNEGFTDHVSVERLARAWREAEADFAAEFDDDEYDLSDMGAAYDHIRQTSTNVRDVASDDLRSSPLDPPYEFSPLSRTYGCIQTPAADLAPPAFPPDLYERGLQHFGSGEISAAVLCFESTLRNVDSEHADAWRMLGKCHTENDADSKAIACWIKSLERDPYSSETLLALVVAYVNELDWEKAVETLRLWVANHPLYAGMEGGVLEGEEDLYGSGAEDLLLEGEGRFGRMRRSTVVEMKDVERLLLRALKFNHDDDAAADVYEALGVVYNVSRDYDAAVDAFRRAIAVRPNDYQLRNKVGATLANSNRSEEALPEYTIALKLKPKYARGWLNMAISHSNLRNYSQAARCYLQTLSLNPEAKHVWSYLRIALTCDEKWDLLPLAASQNLSAFHEHFDFVEY